MAIGGISRPATAYQTTHTKWATLLEITVLGLCLLGPETDAHVLIYRRQTSQLIEEYNDLPAQFGPTLPHNGLKVFAIPAVPLDGCKQIAMPPRQNYPTNAKFVAIIQRGGTDCTFEMKVRAAQAARFDAVIVFNNDGDDLEQMSAQNATGINIPSVFVGHTSGTGLLSFQTPEVVLVINDELPFNINTQLILPFSILIGLCFLIMIFYMIYKCIREERRLRRYRLPKRMLKKLPILKYTKNNTDLSYDTCVICLDDFVEGDKLRVLPCRHPYHSHCIDPWLTENRRVCPVCKRKVFTKREARSNRPTNRQSSLDSVTDTDDDTTPLLQPSSNSNVSTASTAASAGTAVAAAPGAAGTQRTRRGPALTRHGTFRRAENGATSAAEAVTTDDDENVLTGQSTSSRRRTNRVNPFDRTPNPPPDGGHHSSADAGWFSRLFRRFHSPQTISIAAPPFLEEVVHDDSVIAAMGAPDPIISVQSVPVTAATSNNILNPNLSGSFKEDDDDDELPHQSIYEPIEVVAGNDPAVDPDSVFIQTPSRGGIGVVALPNTANDGGAGAGAGVGAGAGRGGARAPSNRQFLI